MQIQPQVQKVRKCESSDDLVDPGDYCYKMIMVAQTNGSSFQKTVVINCPFCGRTQHLAQHTIQVDDRRKTNINAFTRKYFGLHLFRDTSGKLCIKQPIGCAFNVLHQYRIENDEIKLLFKKTR